MSNFIEIKGTYDSPSVLFDPDKGYFRISGRSLPANTFDFYSPLLYAITDYLKEPKEETTFEFKMEFISSSSTKIFQEFLHEIDQAFQKGVKIKVNWYYKFGDDDMKELGDDLRMDTTFPFEFIAYE
ncbi:MAG: DUF1987 domain-containing protein [Bacteroidales bacterium]|nr:DUF1987 domain-containing protein [Bacteroidales bacterium]